MLTVVACVDRQFAQACQHQLRHLQEQHPAASICTARRRDAAVPLQRLQAVT
jgi:hypothetical protein